jgi:molybdenum cofactor guanylyltransferase
MEATLLVLAGGGSRRMGRPKAWIEVGDTVLLRYVVERLGPAFSEVVVSFAEPEQMEQHLPYRVVFDRKRAAGPLAGLEAGLMAARNQVVFAVACDMPYVTQATAHVAVAAAGSCDAAIPRHDGLYEPVCGAYRKTALPAIVAALDAGIYAAHDVVESLDVTWLEGLDVMEFENLNTPSDLERFHAALQTQR